MCNISPLVCMSERDGRERNALVRAGGGEEAVHSHISVLLSVDINIKMCNHEYILHM